MKYFGVGLYSCDFTDRPGLRKNDLTFHSPSCLTHFYIHLIWLKILYRVVRVLVCYRDQGFTTSQEIKCTVKKGGVHGHVRPVYLVPAVSGFRTSPTDLMTPGVGEVSL